MNYFEMIRDALMVGLSIRIRDGLLRAEKEFIDENSRVTKQMMMMIDMVHMDDASRLPDYIARTGARLDPLKTNVK
jgi:hypothetical protein